MNAPKTNAITFVTVANQNRLDKSDKFLLYSFKLLV